MILVVVDLSGDAVMETEMVMNHFNSLNVRFAEKGETVSRENFYWVKKAILIGTKCDLIKSEDRMQLFQESFQHRFQVASVSCQSKENLEELKRTIFNCSELIRVYAKKLHKEPDYSSPFTFKKGTTVLELATHIHKEMADRFQFARVWGSAKFEGQKVERQFVLSDRDVVEIHL